MAVFVVEQPHSGQRFDSILRCFLPHVSLRGVRRLIQTGGALVNGKRAQPALKMRTGDLIALTAQVSGSPVEKPHLIELSPDYCCFWKPRHMHTVRLAGSSELSLESFLPDLVPDFSENARLLQRLDFGTCGIVCAARNLQAERLFRATEKSGQCEKLYLALLEGELREKRKVDWLIDMDNRKKVRLIKTPGDRVTYFEPLAWLAAAYIDDFAGKATGLCTIAACKIFTGARHQIRAHAASIGFPLLGDSLYGGSFPGNFLLEHFRISFPGCRFILPSTLSIFAKYYPALAELA